MGFIKPKVEYKIVTHPHASGLANTVNELIKDGWVPKGSHMVVETHRQNRYAGTQHGDTVIKSEYSQTLIKES